MMRIKSGIICALSMSLAFAVACANSAGPPGGDDDGSGGSQQQASCGDGTCDASEVTSCSADCGSGGNNNNNNAVCGNGQCETTKGESISNCISDCGGQGSGSGSGSGSGNPSTLDCSDFATLFACFACVSDPTACVPPFDAASCQACVGGGGLPGGDLLCEGGAPDGVCNAAAMEDNTTCPSDCP